MSERVLSVDFGSSYTKVALRGGWNDPTRLYEDLTLDATGESPMCIPSMAVQQGERWLFGADALNTPLGPRMKSFRNWKAALLALPPPDAAVKEVAVRFFKWLRSLVKSRFTAAALEGAATRVCVPTFAAKGALGERIREVLSEAGWPMGDQSVTDEPYANVLGVLTQGRNFTHVYKGRRQPMMMQMFPKESGILGAIRQRLKSRDADTRYGAILVDVGSFTTDFGVVYYEDAWSDDMPTHVFTQSEAHGVRELDEEVLSVFPGPLRSAVESMAEMDREEMKQRIYRGASYSRVFSDDLRLTIDEGSYGPRINQALDRFADKLIHLTRRYIDNLAFGINGAFLTGGGLNLQPVRAKLLSYFNSRKFEIHDLQDKNLVVHQVWDGVRWEPDPGEVAINKKLIRGSSAIGAASIYIDCLGGIPA